MINENEFYKQVNERLENTNLEQANNIIKNIVRKIPKNMYKLVLDIMNDSMNINSSSIIDYNEINDKINVLKETFDKINSGELYFRATGYEEYNEWAWESDWVWEYNDEDNISDVIQEAYELAIALVNDKQYKYAKTLFELILYTNYFAYEDEIYDEIELALNTLVSENLININIENLCLYTIYTAYQVTRKEKRCETIYEYFKLREFKDICVKEAFSLGREIPEATDEFWYDFARFLINKTGNIEYKLLKEAVEQLDDTQYTEIVMKCINTHPQMSLDYLKKLNQCGEYENVIKNGDLILKQMDNELVIRSKIALLIASNLNKINQNKNIKEYLYQSFISNTNVANLLKIMFNNGFDEYEERIKQVLNNKAIQTSGDGIYTGTRELIRNDLSEKYIKYFDFFCGDFDKFLGQAKQYTKPLGWSCSFIQDAVYMFLLFMHGDITTRSKTKLIKDVFCNIGITKDDFEFLLDSVNSDEAIESEQYLQIFERWKRIYTVSNEQKQEILNWLYKTIEKRVEAIVKGQHRGSYCKAALLVVALGEVYDTSGIMTKEQFIQQYIQRFPRHTSFRKEITELVK